MSNAIRKLQRNVIRTRCYEQNHNTKGFKKEWDKFHSTRFEENKKNGTVVTRRRNTKRKQRHQDDGRIIMKTLKAMKNFIETTKAAEEKLKKKAVTE